jgi:hypothetical protein
MVDTSFEPDAAATTVAKLKSRWSLGAVLVELYALYRGRQARVSAALKLTAADVDHVVTETEFHARLRAPRLRQRQAYRKDKPSARQSLRAQPQTSSAEPQSRVPTEEAMQFHPVRRLSSGSIDYEFYHRRAALLRAQTMTGLLKNDHRVGGSLLAITVVLAALALAWFLNALAGWVSATAATMPPEAASPEPRVTCADMSCRR